MKNNYKEQSYLKSSPGFTLMEVMLSVSILSMGIVASFALIASSMAKFSSASNKIIASNLAQDGIERVRNVRDDNWLKGRTLASDGTGNSCASGAWDCDIEGVNPSNETARFFCGDASRPSQVPSNPATVDACSSDKCQVFIYEKDITGEYCYSDNMGGQSGYTYVKTNFYRLIRITRLNDYSNRVAVTIKWIDRTGTHYFTAEEILYNWKETD